MKISKNWLKDYISTELPAEEIASLLTGCGLEVEGIEKYSMFKGGLKGLIIGQVLTCSKHPDADKLSLTTVSIGNETPLNIVCGAPNVAAGQKVVVATIGTTLYPSGGEPFVIKKSKIRGASSEGMICAEDEIGLGSSHEGIMILKDDAVVGTTLSQYLNAEDDDIFEIGLTPNRADAASHFGVARDLAAVLAVHPDHQNKNNPKASLPVPEGFMTISAAGTIKVRIDDPASCIRYSGITITGITVGESPDWLQHRLKSIGVGPINNIVDITNFVLHECGQPLHAFDADQISGHQVIVRKAKQGEQFVTLDGIQRKMNAGDLMICNPDEAMCIAGVFGGIKSGITSATKNIFLESACFSPASIRKTSKQHGLKTDASFRFERGTDPEGTLYALERAALMITRLAGGQIASAVIDEYPEKVKRQEITLSYDYISRFTGGLDDRKSISTIASMLGMEKVSDSEREITFSIPTSKVDVTRPVDAIEELLRIYGYDRIAIPARLNASLPVVNLISPEKLQSQLSSYLSSNGFFEILSNSLTSLELNRLCGFDESRSVTLLNPLSQELNALRQTMLISALQSLQYNRNRKSTDLKFYEFGKIYSNEGAYPEQEKLSLIITGKKYRESWTGDQSQAGFFFLRSFVEGIMLRCGINEKKIVSAPADSPQFYEAVSISSGQKILGTYGVVNPDIAEKFDLTQPVLYAEFNFSELFRAASRQRVKVEEISKFPSVRRDLSIILDSGVTFGEIEKLSYSLERKLLKEVNVFDVYAGEKIEKGKKSYAVSFILQDDDQTLTDKQIERTMERIMQALEKELKAEIRKQ